MKEIRTLILVLFCVGILYWFIEPYAHTKLSPHTDPVNYDFAAGDTALAAHNVAAACRVRSRKRFGRSRKGRR